MRFINNNRCIEKFSFLLPGDTAAACLCCRTSTWSSDRRGSRTSAQTSRVDSVDSVDGVDSVDSVDGVDSVDSVDI